MRRETFPALDEAIASAQQHAEEVRRQGKLETVKAFRDYTPDERVHARIEVSGPGILRTPEGGVDVMGDGRLVAYRGSVFKRPLEPGEGESPFDMLRRVLAES